jgi:hypothetical protein
LTDQEHSQSTGWDEGTSQDFLDYGDAFIPFREHQLELLSSLIPIDPAPFRILELCSGDGSLGQRMLERHPGALWLGYDGSPVMLERAAGELARFGDRVTLGLFDLRQVSWRQADPPYRAIVSSMAIHHLGEDEKRQLYKDLFAMLVPGGVLGIADIILPVGKPALEMAALQWDEAVRQRSLELEGNLRLAELFDRERWNIFRYPDPMDKPSSLVDQLAWLEEAGFCDVNVYWLNAGHAVFGGWRCDGG